MKIENSDNHMSEISNVYQFPPVLLLKKGNLISNNDEYIDELITRLHSTLISFGIAATVVGYSCGPVVTTFELQLESGVRINKIYNLQNEIKLSLAVKDIRILSPINGKPLIGIEIPNSEKSLVRIRDLIESSEFENKQAPLTFAIGKNNEGCGVYYNIEEMPHLLIAGATGSGKSTCIHSIIMSILFKADPMNVKMILVDPQMIELQKYNGIPHLLIPVVTEQEKALAVFNWAIQEMTKRYQLFSDNNVHSINEYNKKVDDYLEIISMNKGINEINHMPRIVIIVDEYAQLIMGYKRQMEEALISLAAHARAAGIHLIFATQRPSVNVVTGLIKANFPSRIAFMTSSSVDSKIILDMAGAEKLQGNGDMLFYPAGYLKPIRIQGSFVSEDEINAVVDFLKYRESFDTSNQSNNSFTANNYTVSSNDFGDEKDEYFQRAAELIIESNKASVGMLQRKLKIGFSRAFRIMDQLEDAGIVGSDEGVKPRSILMNQEQFEKYKEEYM